MPPKVASSAGKPKAENAKRSSKGGAEGTDPDSEAQQHQSEAEAAAEKERLLASVAEAELNRLMQTKGEVLKFGSGNVRSALERTFGSLYKATTAETAVAEGARRGDVSDSAQSAAPSAGEAIAAPVQSGENSQVAEPPVSARVQSIRDQMQVFRSTAGELEAIIADQTKHADAQDEKDDLSYMHEGLVTGLDIPAKTAALLDEGLIKQRHDLVDLNRVLDDTVSAQAKRSLARHKEMPASLQTHKSNQTAEREQLEQRVAETKQREIEQKRAKAAALRAQTHGFVPDPRSPEEKRLAERRRELTYATMPASQVQQNRKVLQRMREKLQYRKNPRLHTGNVTFAAPCAQTTVEPVGTAGLLIAEPEQVQFTEYEVGGEYETAVLLRNNEAVGRHFRVLPPETHYFSISAARFPGQGSLVAPGMAVEVRIRFTPDSLRDYEDTLTVFTDTGVYSVAVLGQRWSPELDINPCVDVGFCLVGHTVTYRFPCTNHGGPGRFLIADNDLIDAVGETAEFRSAPFTISPAHFMLDHGETVVISVGFAPGATDTYSVPFRIICDNEQQQHYSVQGRGTQVQLRVASINDVAIAPQSDVTTSDGPTSHSIVFDDLAVHGTASKRISVNNDTPLPVRYAWRLQQHEIAAEAEENDAPVFSIAPPYGVMAPHSSTYFEWSFHPTEAAQFDAEAQLMIGEPQRDTGICASPATPADSADEDQSTACTTPALAVAAHGRGAECGVAVEPPALLFAGPLLLGVQYTQPLRVRNTSQADTVLTWQPHPPGDDLLVEVWPATLDVPAGAWCQCEVRITCNRTGSARLQLHGDVRHGKSVKVVVQVLETAGPNLVIRQPEIDFGLLNFGIAGVSSEHYITLENKSPIPARFVLQEQDPYSATAPYAFSDHDMPPNAEARLQCFPTSGSVPPYGARQLCVRFRPMQCSSLRSTLECRVEHGHSSFIAVRGEVQAPRMSLEPARLQMNQAFVGVEQLSHVLVHNHTHLQGRVAFHPVQETGCSISIEPDSAVIDGHETRMFAVRAVFTEAGERELDLGCDVEGLDLPLVTVLEASVLPLRVSFHSVPVDAASRTGAAQAVKDARNALFSAATQTSHGAPIEMQGDAAWHWQEETQALRLSAAERACRVLDEAYPNQKPEDGMRTIDFGSECPIFSRQTRRFVIRNHSAIRSHFSLAMMRFGVDLSSPCRSADPEDQPSSTAESGTMNGASKLSRTLVKAARASWLHGQEQPNAATINLDSSAFPSFNGTALRERQQRLGMSHARSAAGSKSVGKKTEDCLGDTVVNNGVEEEGARSGPFRSATGQMFNAVKTAVGWQQQALIDGNGVAFLLYPASGVLEPWDVAEVELVCVSDMGGLYADALFCQVEGAPSAEFPVRVGVRGSPLEFSAMSSGMTFPSNPITSKHATLGCTNAANQEQCSGLAQARPALCRPQPVLTWKPLVTGGGTAQREVRVDNSGPLDVRLQWQLLDPATAPLDRVLQLRLDTQLDGTVRLSLTPFELPCSSPSDDVPFSLDASCLVVPARSFRSFRIGFAAPQGSGPAEYKGLLTARVSVRPSRPRPLSQADIFRRNHSRNSGPVGVRTSVLSPSRCAPNAEQQQQREALQCSAVLDEFETKHLFSVRPRSSASSPDDSDDERLSQADTADFSVHEVFNSTAGSDHLRQQQQKLKSSLSSATMQTSIRPQERQAGEEQWLPAPEALLEHPLVLHLVASTVQPHLEASLVDAENGDAAFAFDINQFVQQGRRKRAAPCIRRLPLVNKTNIPLRCEFFVEPAESFQVLSVTTNDGVEHRPPPLPHREQRPGTTSSRRTRTSSVTGTSVFTGGSGATSTFGGEGRNGGNSVAALPESTSVMLAPSSGVSVALRYIPPRPKDYASWPEVPVHRCPGAFIIVFPNGDVQRVPLEARLHRPVIRLDRQHISFGSVHITDTKRAVLRLDNISCVDAQWKILHQPRMAKLDATLTSTMRPDVLSTFNHPEFVKFYDTMDDPSVFSIADTKGVVNAESVALSKFAPNERLTATRNGPGEIAIAFHPRAKGRYRCCFQVVTEQAVPRCYEFVLEGEGSLDEALVPIQ